MVEASMSEPAASAGKAAAMSKLSFPANHPPSATPEGGVHLDASVLHHAAPGGPALRRMLAYGLQAAYRSEASARERLPALDAAVTTPAFRQCLDQILARVRRHLEKLQHAPACFGVSHDAADAPPLAIGAALAVHADRAAALSMHVLLQNMARAAGLTAPVPFLRDCAAGAHRSTDDLTRLCIDELVPAAIRADSDPLPDAFMRLVFGTAPAIPAPAFR